MRQVDAFRNIFIKFENVSALFHDIWLVVINISINHFNNLFTYGIRERMNYNNN